MNVHLVVIPSLMPVEVVSLTDVMKPVQESASPLMTNYRLISIRANVSTAVFVPRLVHIRRLKIEPVLVREPVNKKLSHQIVRLMRLASMMRSVFVAVLVFTLAPLELSWISLIVKRL
jgi:hypothetical protein